MGSKYVVDIEFRQSGDPSALADKAGGKVDALKSKFDQTKASSSELGSEFAKLGSSAVGVFTGLVEKVGAVAMGLGELAIGTGIAAVTYGVLGLNSELETTKVSLGAVLNANDKVKGIDQGVEVAAGWIAQMKKDARDLPGEFEDLLAIVQSSAGTAFNAGMDVPKFEKVASSVMAAAKALNVETHQAGRELAQLFEGRAGAHNVLGMRLKIDAHALYEDIDKVKKHFKDLSAEGRVKAIEDAVGKFEPAIKAFGNTYDAQSSTLVDNVKNLIQLGTKELFGRVVNDLGEINDWFANNRDTVEQYARQAGHWLVDVHDKARKIAEEWIPILKNFGERAYGKFVELWKDAGPIIEGIAKSVKDFLGDKDSVDRMTTLLKLYIAAKVGGAVLGGGPLAGVMKAGIADLGGTGAGVASSAGGGLLAAGGGAGAAFLAAAAGVALAVWQGMELANDSQGRRQGEWSHYVDMAELATHKGRIDTAGAEAQGALVEAYNSANNLRTTIDMVISGSVDFRDALSKNTEAAADAALNLQYFVFGLQNASDDLQKAFDAQLKQDSHDLASDALNRMTAATNAVNAAGGYKADDPNKKKKKDLAGTGTTNVNINVTISSNQAPDQIAREVVRKIVDKRRFRTSSPGTRNFSVLPSGS